MREEFYNNNETNNVVLSPVSLFSPIHMDVISQGHLKVMCILQPLSLSKDSKYIYGNNISNAFQDKLICLRVCVGRETALDWHICTNDRSTTPKLVSRVELMFEMLSWLPCKLPQTIILLVFCIHNISIVSKQKHQIEAFL